jgi:integrator complex subunit 11
MALLRARIQSELGIPCYYPANNETVHISSTHYIKSNASNLFIQSSTDPNFKFLDAVSEQNSDPVLKVHDNRVSKGIITMEKNKNTMIVHEDELLAHLQDEKHEVRFANCCMVRYSKLHDKSYCLGTLFDELSKEVPELNIQNFGEYLEVESFRVSVCLKEKCCYRISESNMDISEGVYYCCTWQVPDEKLAWQIIATMKNLELTT